MENKIYNMQCKLELLGAEVLKCSEWAIKYILNNELYVMNERGKNVINGIDELREVELLDNFVVCMHSFDDMGFMLQGKLYTRNSDKNMLDFSNKAYKYGVSAIGDKDSKIIVMYDFGTSEKLLVTNKGEVIRHEILKGLNLITHKGNDTYTIVNYGDCENGKIILRENEMAIQRASKEVVIKLK